MTSEQRSIGKIITEGTISASLGNIFVRGLSVIGYALVLHRLSLHDYGVFTLLISLMAPALAIILFGFDRVFVSSIAQARGAGNMPKVKGLIQQYYGYALLFSGVCLAGGYFFKNILARTYDIHVLEYFWLVSAVVVAQMLFNMVQLVLEGHEELNTLALLQSVEAISRSVLIVALLPHLGISTLLLIHAAAKGVAVVVGFRAFGRIWKTLSEVRGEQGAFFGVFQAQGKWDITRAIVDDLTAPLKVWLVKFFVDTPSVAIYDFAQNVYSFFLGTLPIKGVIFPVVSRVASEARERAYLIITKAKKYLLLFYSVQYLIALIVFSPFIHYFFPQYAASIVIVFAVLLHVFTDTYKVGQAALIYGLNQQKFQFFLAQFGLLLQLVLDISFTYYWGVMGIIFSWHLQAIILGIATNRYLHKKFNVVTWDWNGFFSYDEYDQILVERIKKISYTTVRKLLPFV